MWSILNMHTGDTFCFAKDKQPQIYTVGRTDPADLKLGNDVSISRSHAVFHLVKNQMQLEDVGSKYGTYVNDLEKARPLEKDNKVELKNNDLIRFGHMQNLWKLQLVNYTVVTSTLNAEDKETLRGYMEFLGGTIVDQWSDECSHLVMTETSMTTKLLHALVNQKIIVNMMYWKELVNAIKKNEKQLPKPEDYRPIPDSEHISNADLSLKPERSTIFKGITFIFLNRKHSVEYGPIIKKAGGTYKDLNAGVQKALLIKQNVVVIQYIPSTQSQSSETINTINDYLETHSKRIIPEYEIGLAIVYCTMEKYCNPNYQYTETMPLNVSDSKCGELTTGNTVLNTNNSEALDLEIPETDELVNDTEIIKIDNNMAQSENEDKMPNSTIEKTSATGSQQLKRKHIKTLGVDSDRSDGENDNLFTFSKKKCTNKDSMEIENSEQEFANETKKCQGRTVTPTITSNEKTLQRKRTHIQVLDDNIDNNEEDDIFNFGNNERPSKIVKRSTSDADENNANNFGNISISSTKATTAKKISLYKTIPAAKILPQKIDADGWLVKKEIKTEKLEENDGVIKNENDSVIKKENEEEELPSDECRKWIEDIKDAVQILKISVNHSNKNGVDHGHYKCKQNGQNMFLDGSNNGATKNFKAFKKNWNAERNNETVTVRLRVYEA